MNLRPTLLASLLILAACSSSDPHAGHNMPMPTGAPKQLAMQAEEAAGTDIAFTIREKGEVFEDFGVSHTKEMHLLVVRNDLRHFLHVHPSRDVSGVWHVEYEPPAGGTYWIYADFIDKNNVPYTLRLQKEFAGAVGESGVLASEEMQKTVDGFTVTFAPTRTATSTTLTYIVTDGSGNAPMLEDYLAAKAHIVVLSPTGEFYHLHGTETMPGVVEASAEIPLGAMHRAFMQFQVAGKVSTVEFDLPAEK